MDELHRLTNRLATELQHIEHLLESKQPSAQQVELALSVAKRVRRNSNLLTRALAQQRDQLQPKGGTS